MFNYIRHLTLALDHLLNVLLFNGLPNETVSVNAANARNQGKRWACILCRWFDLTIERDHCNKALLPIPTPIHAGVRALIQLIVITALIYYIPIIIW